jgi:hypothetical protein
MGIKRNLPPNDDGTQNTWTKGESDKLHEIDESPPKKKKTPGKKDCPETTKHE